MTGWTKCLVCGERFRADVPIPRHWREAREDEERTVESFTDGKRWFVPCEGGARDA
jgi:hypothetical protein